MSNTPEIIIIGAGIGGTSMAYFLASKGIRDILVVEKKNVASGATGSSSAMISPIRETVSELAWKSVQIYQNWAQTIGGDIGYKQTGNLSIFENCTSQYLYMCEGPKLLLVDSYYIDFLVDG